MKIASLWPYAATLRGSRKVVYQARAGGNLSEAALFDAVHASTSGKSGDFPEDTIVALSSGSGRSAVAVIRLSGPRSGKPRGVLDYSN